MQIAEIFELLKLRSNAVVGNIRLIMHEQSRFCWIFFWIFTHRIVRFELTGLLILTPISQVDIGSTSEHNLSNVTSEHGNGCLISGLRLRMELCDLASNEVRVLMLANVWKGTSLGMCAGFYVWALLTDLAKQTLARCILLDGVNYWYRCVFLLSLFEVMPTSR